MQPVYGNHIGIVISNNDPENRNRVQIYVPYVSNTLFAGWNQSLTDKYLQTPNDLDRNILNKLQKFLPWAESASPIFGGSTGINANSGTGKQEINGAVGRTLSDPTYTGDNNIVATIPYNPNAPSESPLDSRPISLPLTGDINGDGLTIDNPQTGGKPFVAYTTKYSFGPELGGPDKKTTWKSDPGTMKGLGNYGRQVLGPGAAATNDSGLPNGTILYSPSTKEKVMIVDTSGSDTAGNIDVWRDPALYNKAPSGNLDWQVVGNAKSMPKTNEELQASLANYPGTIPEGKSAAAWLGNLQDGKLAINNPPESNTTPSPTTATIDPSLDAAGARIAASHDRSAGGTGSPSGSFHVPDPGAKVWVFFYGGDVQKPIYFAAVTDPSGSATLS